MSSSFPPIPDIQNGEEGGVVRNKLNAVIGQTNKQWDHSTKQNNPHNVKAPQVKLEPVLAPLSDSEQNVQDALEFLFEYFSESDGDWHLSHIDGNHVYIEIKHGPNSEFPPTTADLKLAELKINHDEGQLWTRLADNTIVKIGDKNFITEAPLDGELYGRKDGEWHRASGTGLIISPTPPKNVPTGTQWLDSVNAVVYIWDEDKWLEFPAGHGADVEIADLPPANPNVGDMWTDYGTTGELYIWDGRFWVSMTGEGGPTMIIGGGEENPNVELPENLVFDRVESLEDYDKALARFIAPDNTGKWGQIKTGDIKTDPSVTFRDSNGRFKSTKEYEELTDQLKVNRFLANKLEDQREAIEGQGGLLDETNAGLVRIDSQVAENVSNIVQLQESIGGLEGYDDAELIALIEELPVIVATDPPEITKDGELWYDDDRLELFVSYQDAWISTTPLSARVEAGEALQAEILARVEAGEIKQATIESDYLSKKGGTANKFEGTLYMGRNRITGLAGPDTDTCATNREYVDNADNKMQSEILGRVEAGEIKQATIEANAMTKGGAQTLTDDHWSVKTDDGKTYMMISDDEITMYHVAKPDAPKQPTNKEYVDSADNKMQSDISNLEAKVIELEGSIGEHRFIYNNQNSNPRYGDFVCKDVRYEITDVVDDARYLEFGTKDVNGVPVDYAKIKAGDVLRMVGPAGERAELSIEDVSESGTFLISGATITGLDAFVKDIQYATTILSAFDPTGLASINYVDTQDAKKLSLSGGTANKMRGNLYLGGFFIAGLGEPTAGNHAATMQYVDTKVASIGQSGTLDPHASNFIMPGYGLTGAGELVGGKGVFKFVRMDGAGFTSNPEDSRGICFDIHKYPSFFDDLKTKLDTGTCYGTGIIYVWDENLSDERALIAKYRLTNKGNYDTQGDGSFFIYGDQLMARSTASTTDTYRIELVGF